MANRLSLQSATCNAFQLQLCRQPYNDNDTKTVSSFGSDCTRAIQRPMHNPTTWWGITEYPAYSECASVFMGKKICRKKERESARIYLIVLYQYYLLVQEGRSFSYCSAVMYPSSCGVHCTPATSTLPTSSEKDRPRFKPWIVTRVPPSKGPASGFTYIEERN